MDVSLIIAAAIAASPGLAGLYVSTRNGRKTDAVAAKAEETHAEVKHSIEAVAQEVTASNGQTLVQLVEKWENLRQKAEKEREAALKRLAAMKEAGQA